MVHAMLWMRLSLLMFAGLAGTGSPDAFLLAQDRPQWTGGVATVWATDQQRSVLRGPDGLFRVQAKISGQRVTMIVDTGATHSILAAATARRLGLGIGGVHEGKALRTLAGDAPYRSARVSELIVGDAKVSGLQIAVMATPGDISVLGQDALRRLGPITLSGDHLIFH